MSFVSRRSFAFVVPILIALLASTCAEGPTGNRILAPKRSSLALSTQFTPAAEAAAALIHAAGLDVDRVQVVISRSPSETLRDTSIALVAGQDQTLTLDVPVDAGTSLTATVNYYAGAVLLYSGSSAVTAYPPNTPAEQIPVSTVTVVAVAPGSAATRLTVAGPAPSPTTAPVTMAAHAFLASGAEIAGAIFGWTVDDPTVATITGAGVLTPTAKSGTVQVTAITLSGVSGTTAVNFYGPPAKIVTQSGDAQTATVGTAVAQPFVVQVQSANGAGVPNQTVTFGAANGSSVAPTSATTDANGRAQTVPTLGNTPGTFGFTATTGTFTTTISATATAGAAATITVVSGDAQSDTVQKTLKNPLVVKVVDKFGNPTANATVNWARTAGTGAVSAATSATDPSGLANISYTLGAAVGTETISASIAGVATAATFTATALQKPASIALLSGGNQTGTVGTALTQQVSFKVLDTQGNPAPNVTVVFQTANGGSFVPASVATDATGVAKTVWTLGTTPGTQTMTGAATGLSGSPVTVTATATAATPPPAVALQYVQQPSAVAAGSVIAPAITVRAVDINGNLVPTFTGSVTIGFGTAPTGATLGGTVTRAAVSGVATFNDLTASTVGTGYTLSATSAPLAGVVSATFNVTIPANAHIDWVNASGGNWNVASNWSLNRVPNATDSIVIAAAGTYTVVLDTNIAASSALAIGGGSGVQTLSITGNRTLVVNSSVLIKPTGVLRLSGGSVTGTAPLINQGTILVPGSGVVSNTLTMATGSKMTIAADGSTGNAALAVAHGFTNDGVIDLSSTVGGYPSLLSVSGKLVNSATGIVNASAGAGGARVLDVVLDNRGTLNVGAPLTLQYTVGTINAQHANTGTINVSDADLSVVQAGTTPSFTNSGAIVVGQGRTFRQTSGTFTSDAAGTLTGAGGIVVANAIANFNAVQLAALELDNTTATFLQPLSTQSTVIVFDGSTVNGSVTLTNAANSTLQMRGTTLFVALDNRGTLLANETNTLIGQLTTAAGSTIRVQSVGQTGQGVLNVNQNFTNNGTIELTSSVGGYPSTLSAPSNTITNSPTGIISALAGSGGQRTIAGTLINQGVLNVGQALNMAGTSAAQINSGSINLVGGDFTLFQSAGSGSFVNNNGATIAINAGRTFTLSNGTFSSQGNATLSGAGTLVLDNNIVATFEAPVTIGGLKMTNHAVANLAFDLSSATTAFSMDNSTVNGPGRLVNVAGKSMSIRQSTVAATSAVDNTGTLLAAAVNDFNGPLTANASSTLTIQADGQSGVGTLNVANGFQNNGMLNLTTVAGGYPTSLVVAAGTLINGPSATITSAPGAGGPRTISAPVFTNNGSLTVSLPLTLTHANGTFSNTGLISANSSFSVDYAGGTGTFTNSGGITTVSGSTVTVTGGTFTQSGSITGAGKLSLVNSTVTSNSNLPLSMTIDGGDVTFPSAFSTASTTLDLSNTTLHPNGGLTNVATKTLTMRNSTLATSGVFENDGIANFLNANALNVGQFITTTTSHMVVYSDGLGGGVASLNVGVPFTNAGIIDLTSVGGGYPATISTTSGAISNSGGATINALVGAGGAREINAQLLNQGTIAIAQQLTIDRNTATHQNQNGGVIQVTGASLILGGVQTFINNGTITVAPTQSITVSTGTFTETASGTLNGGGSFIANGATVNVVSPITLGGLFLESGTNASFSGALTINSGMTLDVNASTLGGGGQLINAAGGVVTLQHNGTISISAFTNSGTLNVVGDNTITSSPTTSPTSQIEIIGNGSGGDAKLTLPGFVNNGALDLLSQGGGFGATLNLTGALTNASGSTMSALTGTGGLRTIIGNVVNNGGSITIGTGLTSGLSIAGTYSSTPNTQIFMTLASATDYSQFHTNTNNAAGASSFFGPVQVQYANGYTPATGTQFTLFTFGNGNGSGTFNSSVAPPGGFSAWSANPGSNSYTLTKGP